MHSFFNDLSTNIMNQLVKSATSKQKTTWYKTKLQKATALGRLTQKEKTNIKKYLRLQSSFTISTVFKKCRTTHTF